ncbi:MAG: hypothetical protein Phog2KO_49580 [Phototrophicaceae bacterium]
MGANAYWSDFYHRVIILEFTAKWTRCEYDNLVKESVNMLNSVRHKVAIVIDFSQSKNDIQSPETYRIWLDTVYQWRETASYSNFWINVNPPPWEQLILWTIGLVYNRANVMLAETVDEACSFAVEMLDKMPSS